MDHGNEDSPQRTQRGAEVCCFSLRASAVAVVFFEPEIHCKRRGE